MNITNMRLKHNDHVIMLAVREVVLRGLNELEKEAKAPGRKSQTDKALYAVIKDLYSTRYENYNDFRAIIKRCL